MPLAASEAKQISNVENRCAGDAVLGG